MSKVNDNTKKANKDQHDKNNVDSLNVEMPNSNQSGSQTELENIEAVERFSPGSALVKAREHLGVSLEEIADKTAVPIVKLKLLEEDKFDQLGPEVFVVAYLKKYAVILALPESELIADYRSYRSAAEDATAQEYSDDNGEVKVSNGSLSPKQGHSPLNLAFGDSSFSSGDMFYSRSSSKPIFKKVGFWLLIILALLSWGAYEMFVGERAITLSNELGSTALPPLSISPSVNEEENATPQKDELRDGASSKPSEELSSTALSATQAEDELAAPEESLELVDISALKNTPVLNTEVQKKPESIESETGNSRSQLVGVSEPEPKPVTESVDVNAIEEDKIIAQLIREQEIMAGIKQEQSVQVNNQTVTSEKVQLDRLDIDFNDDCWLEVTDSSGEVSIAKLKRGGENTRIFGAAPFTVKLGNARAAQLHINGQLFTVPFNRNSSRKTIKFNVTKQSENAI